MNKSIVFKICLLLIVCISVISTVHAYETTYRAQIASEGVAKGSITFTRTSVASETTREAYLKIAGGYGKPVNSVDFILPTTATYQIAYYMFSNQPSILLASDGEKEGVTEYGYLSSTGYSRANFKANPAFKIDDCISSGKSHTINRYIKNSDQGDYVVEETTDKFFEYNVVQICIVKKKDANGKFYYELQETIALNSEATEILQNVAEQIYITPVFYTKGTPADTPTSSSQSIYADQFFYAYTLGDFFQMKDWSSSVYGWDSIGIYSVINQLGNKINVPEKKRTETVILKYVRLTARDQLLYEGTDSCKLTNEGAKISPKVIAELEYEYEADGIYRLNIIEKLGSQYNSEVDELVAYSRRYVNSKSDLIIGRPVSGLNYYENTINIRPQQNVVEIIVYSIPRMFDCTIKISHVAYKNNSTTLLSNLPANEQIKLSFDNGSNWEECTNSNLGDEGLEGVYNFSAVPGTTPKINLVLRTDAGLVDMTSIHYKVNGVKKGDIKKDATELTVDSLGAVGIGNTVWDIDVVYYARRGTSAEVDYLGKGSLKVATFYNNNTYCYVTDSKDGPKILSIPNNDSGSSDVKVYLGTEDALVHYVKGITSDGYLCYNEKTVIDGGKSDDDPDAYNVELAITVDGPIKGDVDKNTTYIRDQYFIRLHKITQIAVYSMSKIDFFNSGGSADTLGAELFDVTSYTKTFNLNDYNIEIEVIPADTTFYPWLKIYKSSQSYWSSRTQDEIYPLSSNFKTTIQDFKNNVIDIISPYAFTDTNPYARTFKDANNKVIKSDYEYTTYDFDKSVSCMVNSALGLADDTVTRSC